MKTFTLSEPRLCVACGILSLVACSAGAGGTASSNSSNANANAGAGNGNGVGTSVGGAGSVFVVGDAGIANGGARGQYVPEQWPPDACVSVITEKPDAATDLAGTGAYCQGPAVTSSTAVSGTIQDSAGCGTVLWGIARDFLDHNQAPCGKPVGAPHPDFGGYCCGSPQLGTVLPDLGNDGKPLYNPANITGNYPDGGVGLTGQVQFDQWYRDTSGINVPYLVGFDLVPSGDGKTSIFSSRMYFPLDSVGFDVGTCSDSNYGHDNKRHNFRFTTELHTKFKYLGGEVFSFFGDDDVWVFINKKLALDMGGVHSRMEGTVNLDAKANALGLVIGQVYSMDLFQAERFGSESNFEITTSMTFVDCGINPTPIVN